MGKEKKKKKKKGTDREESGISVSETPDFP